MSAGNSWVVAVVLLVATGCGGKDKGDLSSSAPGADGEPAVDPDKLARTILSLEFSEEPSNPPSSEVYVVFVDENGASERHPVGPREGACRRLADAAPGGAMAGQLMRAECTSAKGGVELRFVQRRTELHVLEARFDDPKDERSFEQRGSVKLPTGDKIEVSAP